MGEQSKQLKTGKFNKKELSLYEGVTEKDKQIILDYQKKLPCLQQDNDNWINGRKLYEQLCVKKHFADWIKQQLEDIDAEEDTDFITNWYKGSEPYVGNAQYSPQKLTALGYSKEYLITIETAKEVSMVAGARGGKTNKELKENSKLARKYFIAIEKAFESRYIWNESRQKSIDAYHDLRKIVFADMYNENKLKEYLPKWWSTKVYLNGKGYITNTYSYELYLLDLIIIGMSAKEYRQINNLKSSELIRNTFNDEQLEDFEMLQCKSAEYLEVQGIWNTNERYNTLVKFYKYYKKQSA